MNKQEIKSQQTLRISNKELLAKLNEKYNKSGFKTANAYLNSILDCGVSNDKTIADVNTVLEILKEKNLSNQKFEEQLLKTLKDLVKKVNIHERILCRTYHILKDSAFKHLQYEGDYDTGKYDELPTKYKDYLTRE